MSDLITEARNAELPDLMDILRDQRARRLDLVVPAQQLRFVEGNVVVAGVQPLEKYEDLGNGEKMLLEVIDPNGTYRPTRIFDEHLADRLEIPTRYVRRMRETGRTDLLDLNGNGWLQGRKAKVRKSTAAEIEALGTEENPAMGFDEDTHTWFTTLRPAIPGDTRKFMLRTYRGGDGELGVARALMSNRFAPYDNLDGLAALMEGLKAAGIDPQGLVFDQLDLTERGMSVRVSVPEIRALAPQLLKGYSNPFVDGVERAPSAVRGLDIDGWRKVAKREGMGYNVGAAEQDGGEPIVSAGVRFTNSEVGNGSWMLCPEIVVKVCRNGLQLNALAHAERHVGKRLDDGVQWAADTQAANLEVVVKQTRDLVAQFLDQGYFQARVEEIEELAGAKLDKPAETIKVIGKKVGFTDDQVEGIFNFFLRGGQPTAGGVANAITAYSQTVENPDEARKLDAKAVEAMAMAAL